jgi:hypothetical protein
MVLKKPGHRRGAGTAGIGRGTRTLESVEYDNGDTCTADKSSGHRGERFHWRVGRRGLRAAFNLVLGNYFANDCFGLADTQLATAGVFPDKVFPRGLYRRKRFTLRFDETGTVQVGPYDVRFEQDVVLRFRRKAWPVYRPGGFVPLRRRSR